MFTGSTRLIGSIVLPDKILKGTIHVQDGKIERIEEGFPQDIASTDNVYDFRGKYLLPGLIEVHGHMRSRDSIIKKTFRMVREPVSRAALRRFAICRTRSRQRRQLLVCKSKLHAIQVGHIPTLLSIWVRRWKTLTNCEKLILT